jgi:hypothetical protein
LDGSLEYFTWNKKGKSRRTAAGISQGEDKSIHGCNRRAREDGEGREGDLTMAATGERASERAAARREAGVCGGGGEGWGRKWRRQERERLCRWHGN